MRIGIDARWIFRELSGIPTYTRELLRQFRQLDSQNEYVLFFDDPKIAEETATYTGCADAANFRSVMLPYGLFSVRSQLQLPGVVRREKLDVFHSPNYMIPFLAFPRNRVGPARCVVTIHDLIPLIFPEFTPRAKKTRFMPIYRRVMTEVGARADVILTVSRHSREDVIREMKIPESKQGRVVAIPNGVSEKVSQADGSIISFLTSNNETSTIFPPTGSATLLPTSSEPARSIWSARR